MYVCIYIYIYTTIKIVLNSKMLCFIHKYVKQYHNISTMK